MVNISELNDSDVGTWVLYDNGPSQQEPGRIKSWNDKYVFVVYSCDKDWDNYKNYTGAATNPEELTYIGS